MPLLILLFIAGVIGYFLATSRFRQPIDEAAGRVAATSRSLADQGWKTVCAASFAGAEPATTVIDAEAVEAPQAEKKPAGGNLETNTENAKE